MSRFRIIAPLIVCAIAIAAYGATSKWALVNNGAANFRSNPTHSSELETQATFGTPVQIIRQQGEWFQTSLPDGYRAWVHTSSVTPIKDTAFDSWRSDTSRVIVTAPYVSRLLSKATPTAAPIADLPMGAIMTRQGNTDAGEYIQVALPDGRTGYVCKHSIKPFVEFASQLPDSTTVTATARSMLGLTYLWGGTTHHGVDCSGLTKAAYHSVGIQLPRNASQQARCGKAIDLSTDSLRTGDLLFFGPSDQRITHVAIYLCNGLYIHSSGRVRYNSIVPTHPLYLPRKPRLARRILTHPPQTIATHPWYIKP